jgi:tRNA A58 N-methylase Trm61
MPEMSSFERAFCCGAVWRSSSATIARELRTQRLGRDILEIGAGSGSVAKQLLSSNPELGWTAIDIDPLMVHAAATRLREYDLTRTPLASLFHRLDGSPHRLIVPDDFREECARNGLTISLQSRLLGHVMRFVAHKN